MVNTMEWERQVWQQNGGNAEMMYVKVMTDEQLETLRKQIAVYATLCEQLAQMHKNLSAHQDLTGVRLGSVYCDPLMGPGGHKLTSRQRWTPTAAQLQILERIFDQGTGTPSKEKIKEITAELGQHGQISETNVYNWFQNRRARSKRKQQNVQPASKTESEVEPQDDSKDKKSSPRELPSLPADNLCFRNPDVCSNLYLDPESNKLNSVFPLDASLTATRNFDDVPVFNGMLSNSDDDDYLTGKMDAPESYNLYQQASDYNMVGGHSV